MTRKKENNQPEPGMFTAVVRLSEPPRSLFSTARLLSIGIHAALVGAALVPWMPAPATRPKLTETTIVLHSPARLFLNAGKNAGRPGNEGGGGKREPTPASLGRIPRTAEKQFVPPDPEPPKNPQPELVREPTIVSSQLTILPKLALLNIGDPNGVPGPPSSGTGVGGGIGNEGKGHGVGDREGAGLDDGRGGDGGPRRITGDMIPPVIVFRVEPEYSEEARKARYQGTVLLEAIVKKDGRVDVLHVLRSLGFGLDQSAIEALKQWRFRPATQDGKAVDVSINVEVNFALR